MDGQNFGLSTSAREVYRPPSSMPRCFRSLAAMRRSKTVARVSLSTGTSTTRFAAVRTGKAEETIVSFRTGDSGYQAKDKRTHGDPMDPAPFERWVRFDPAEQDGAETRSGHDADREERHGKTSTGSPASEPLLSNTARNQGLLLGHVDV